MPGGYVPPLQLSYGLPPSGGPTPPHGTIRPHPPEHMLFSDQGTVRTHRMNEGDVWAALASLSC